MSDAPVSADPQVAPVAADAPVSANPPVAADAPVSANSPVAADAPVSADAPVDADAVNDTGAKTIGITARSLSGIETRHNIKSDQTILDLKQVLESSLGHNYRYIKLSYYSLTSSKESDDNLKNNFIISDIINNDADDDIIFIYTILSKKKTITITQLTWETQYQNDPGTLFCGWCSAENTITDCNCCTSYISKININETLMDGSSEFKLFTTEKDVPENGIYDYHDIEDNLDNWKWFTEFSTISKCSVIVVNVDDLDLVIDNNNNFNRHSKDEIIINIPSTFDIYIIRIVNNEEIEER